MYSVTFATMLLLCSCKLAVSIDYINRNIQDTIGHELKNKEILCTFRAFALLLNGVHCLNVSFCLGKTGFVRLYHMMVYTCSISDVLQSLPTQQNSIRMLIVL
ncbi:hypothetical protein DFH11DRAFT_18183 [Phellopilus nigrolimitatus]|nr:hypothetical protein DFH11DRAFT_18183 [Phellopilus nigrolimitatus]